MTAVRGEVQVTQAHVELVREIIGSNRSEWYDIELDTADNRIRVWMHRGLIAPHWFEGHPLEIGHFSCGTTTMNEYMAHVPIRPTGEVSE